MAGAEQGYTRNIYTQTAFVMWQALIRRATAFVEAGDFEGAERDLSQLQVSNGPGKAGVREAE